MWEVFDVCSLIWFTLLSYAYSERKENSFFFFFICNCMLKIPLGAFLISAASPCIYLFNILHECLLQHGQSEQFREEEEEERGVFFLTLSLHNNLSSRGLNYQRLEAKTPKTLRNDAFNARLQEKPVV